MVENVKRTGEVEVLNERGVNDIGEHDNKGDDSVLTEGFIATVDIILSHWGRSGHAE